MSIALAVHGACTIRITINYSVCSVFLMLIDWGEGNLWGESNLRPCRPPCPRVYLYEYTSRGKPEIPPADRILMDPGHKARKNPSDNADVGFQAVGPALCIMQLNVTS